MDNRTQLLDEYYKLSAIIQSYDSYFVSIKAWGVTVSGAAIGVGFSRGGPVAVFIVALALSLAFWFTETSFKLLQLGHFGRILQLEDALREGTDIPSPEIYRGFDKKRKKDFKSFLWLRVLFYPHVMFPHILFVVLSAVYIYIDTKH